MVSDPSSSPHKLFIHPSRGSPRCPCREIRKHICRLHVRRGDLHGRARRGRRQFAAAAGSLRHHASSDHICLRRRSFALRHQRPQGAASDFVDSSTASAFFPCLSASSLQPPRLALRLRQHLSSTCSPACWLAAEVRCVHVAFSFVGRRYW